MCFCVYQYDDMWLCGMSILMEFGSCGKVCLSPHHVSTTVLDSKLSKVMEGSGKTHEMRMQHYKKSPTPKTLKVGYYTLPQTPCLLVLRGLTMTKVSTYWFPHLAVVFMYVGTSLKSKVLQLSQQVLGNKGYKWVHVPPLYWRYWDWRQTFNSVDLFI